MWSIEGTPTAGVRVPPSLVNFPAEHEGDAAPLLAGWTPAKGLSVPITCLDTQCHLLCHTSDSGLGPLGQPSVGAHPVVKKPRVFSQCSRLFGPVMSHVLGQTPYNGQGHIAHLMSVLSSSKNKLL